MDLSKNNFEVIRKEMGLTNRDFAKLLDINETSYTKLKNGTLSIGLKTEMKIRSAFPDISYEWLMYNMGSRRVKNVKRIIRRGELGNAKEIGEIPEEDEGNTKFREISPGYYIMTVPLVPEFAKAGYLTGFADKEYIDELPKREVTVKFYHRGNYVAFEVSGDSMSDGTIDSLPDGCIITTREIKRDLWKSKFHTHKYPNYVFVHKTEGVICKQIKSQDVENGTLLLASLNPDKNRYPDFEISLDDVKQVLNVVKREIEY